MDRTFERSRHSGDSRLSQRDSPIPGFNSPLLKGKSNWDLCLFTTRRLSSYENEARSRKGGVGINKRPVISCHTGGPHWVPKIEDAKPTVIPARKGNMVGGWREGTNLETMTQ